MSNATAPASLPLSTDVRRPGIPAPEPDPVWNAWIARGIAHDRVVRRRFNRIAIVLWPVLVAALCYTWFGPWS
jgi:hypothetical protein